jgi:methylase of polypeptide subunit release factors
MVGESDKNQVVGAGEAGVLVSALEHPMVLAALSRMASSGAWQRVVDGQPLTEETDVVDAQFLVAAGAVTRVADDTFKLAASDPMYSNSQTLAHRTQYLLRRALQHATGQSTGWANEDPETVLSFGRATGAGADIIADLLLPQLPMSAAAFAEGRGSFLDIGVGVGAISIRLVNRYPGTRAIGLDVLPHVLDVAQAEVARSGLSESIDLRLQSVADLHDHEDYDLAWLPQPFIPRPAFLEGIHNVFRALKPGAALVVPVAIPAGASDFARARQVHASSLAGGSTITASELAEVVSAAGFIDLVEHPVSTQILMTATKPTSVAE